MRTFLEWFNAPSDTDAVLKAGLSHLWFVSIHPFDDGNGRIARAISDLALTRADGSPQRCYSMSSQIREERRDYYDILEQTQRETMDVTHWLRWFLECLGRAIANSEPAVGSVKPPPAIPAKAGIQRLPPYIRRGRPQPARFRVYVTCQPA